MCGISLLISTNGTPVDPGLIAKFNNIISHRGPDDEGYYSLNNFSLGHRRLSILDLSSDGHQPMHYLDKYVIVYNGEIYNYLELRTELEEHGYAFNSHTDTEVILASYDFWGEECQHKFNGMWAFIIYNKEKDEFFCSRDRFGIKPFYYAQVGQYFGCASEIKQFTILPEWQAEYNERAINDFIMYGLIDHSEETLFSQIFQLSAGHCMTFGRTDKSPDVSRWYTGNEKTEESIDSNGYITKFRKLFDDAIKLRLRSDVKVGSCLSGGIDSSSIVCTASRILGENEQSEHQETVSACYKDFKFDEREYIKLVVDRCNVRSHEVYPEWDQMVDEIDNITWHQEIPIVSSSLFAQWSVFSKAQEKGLTVMLDGQGADEILAGYMYFFESYYPSLIRSFKWSKLFVNLREHSKLRRISWQQCVKWALFAFTPKPFNKLLNTYRRNRDLPGFNVNGTISEREIDRSSLRTYTLDLLNRYSLPMLLHFEDRNSMAFSIESRVPFLDYRLVEMAINLPDDLKLKNGVTKFVLRESMKGIIPNDIYNRHDKIGFATPESDWLMKNEGFLESEFVEQSAFLEKFIDMNEMLNAYSRQKNNPIQLGSYYWRIFALGRWAKVFGIS